MSYSLFLSLWVLLHGCHFLFCRCSSFLTYIHFLCMGYISLSLPTDSNFTLPSMCSLFILWHNSVNICEPERQKRASKNMAISGLFLLIVFLEIHFDYFSSPLSHTAVFFAILLHCASNCPHFKKRFTASCFVLTLIQLKRKAFKICFY